MVSTDFFEILHLKKVTLIFVICMGCLLLLMTSACIDSDDPDQIAGCPSPVEADALDLKQVFFSPYKNQRYAAATDTVLFSEFRFNFELEIREKENADSGQFPGQAFALSCIRSYHIHNISNISVILIEPFANLPIGTDISYLLVTPENVKLSQLRSFENVSVYFGTRLTLTPKNYSQLKTRTFLFLKNGTQKSFDSTSPFLKTN